MEGELTCKLDDGTATFDLPFGKVPVAATPVAVQPEILLDVIPRHLDLDLHLADTCKSNRNVSINDRKIHPHTNASGKTCWIHTPVNRLINDLSYLA